MQSIHHPRLGHLEYEPDGGWRGWIRLERFAEFRLAGLEAAGKKLARRFADEDLAEKGFDAEEHELVDGEDDGFEEREREEKLAQGMLPIWLADFFGAGKITPAQERSIDYLLDHQNQVLDAVTRHIFDEYTRQLHDLRDYHGQGGDSGTLDDTVPEIDSPEGLERLLAFDDLTVSSEPLRGHVPVVFSYSCTWDQEHGGEVEVLKDEVLDPDEPRPSRFPCALPNAAEATAIPKGRDGRRLVELQIHGGWNGIYEVDDQGNCTGIARRCPLCRGIAWDPEGIEAVREVPPWHRRLAALPHYLLLPGAFAAIAMLSPLVLLAAWFVWPGLFWASLVLPAAALLLLCCYRTYRLMWFRPLTWFALLQIGLSVAALYTWHRYGSLEGGSTLNVLGWIVWAVVACVALASLTFGGMLAVGIGRDAGFVTPALLAPFLLFAALIGTGLWYTAAGDYSKFHLLWLVPVTFVGSVFVGLITTIWVTHRLGKRLEQSEQGRSIGD